MEFRCAIERIVLELYAVIANPPLELKDAHRLRSFTSIISELARDVGTKRVLRRVFQFNAVYCRDVIGLPFKLAVPDTGKLHRLWQDLSDYCHKQVDASMTWGSDEWMDKSYRLLQDTEVLLVQLIEDERRGWVHPGSLPPEMREEREHFLTNDVSIDTLARRLKLIKPVVEDRLRRSRREA